MKKDLLEKSIINYMKPHLTNLTNECIEYLESNMLEHTLEHEQAFILEEYAVKYCDERNITDSYEQEKVFNYFLDWMGSYWV